MCQAGFKGSLRKLCRSKDQMHSQAMEPFFSVLLSALFLGESPSIPVVLSLLPVVGGVALASATEVTFNWPGFLAAMGSNITFQSRNVFSKKFMGKKGKASSPSSLSS